MDNDSNLIQEQVTVKKSEERINQKHYYLGFITGVLCLTALFLAFKLGTKIYSFYYLNKIEHETKVRTIQSLIDKHYNGEVDKSVMNEWVYRGMVAGLEDPYSGYISADEYDEYMENTVGNYAGIGIYTSVDFDKDIIYVKEVFDNSPGKEAGLEKGDVIKTVDDIEMTADSFSEIPDLVKGPEGTEVTLGIFRESTGESLDITVERKSVDIPTVASCVLEENIGYMNISNFETATVKQFEEQYKELRDKNIKGIIIDLRDNPGGLLTSVVPIVDTFLAEGVITYTEDKEGKRKYENSTGEEFDLPLAVITNGGSASASELFAGAIKDRDAGEIVGETTFGKGVVQQIFPLLDGSAVKITTEKYYTPDGICVHGEGVEPDYIVEYDEYEAPVLIGKNIEVDLENDKQLQKALEVVK